MPGQQKHHDCTLQYLWHPPVALAFYTHVRTHVRTLLTVLTPHFTRLTVHFARVALILHSPCTRFFALHSPSHSRVTLTRCIYTSHFPSRFVFALHPLALRFSLCAPHSAQAVRFSLAIACGSLAIRTCNRLYSPHSKTSRSRIKLRFLI